jgi:hypothetical protein
MILHKKNAVPVDIMILGTSVIGSKDVPRLPRLLANYVTKLDPRRQIEHLQSRVKIYANEMIQFQTFGDTKSMEKR